LHTSRRELSTDYPLRRPVPRKSPVVDGENGYPVPPGDPAALANRIGDLLNDSGSRRAMGRRGRARVEELFTFQSQSRQYEELFGPLVRLPSHP
jgi:D-inositol-3-phosphate glycosyltransferase